MAAMPAWGLKQSVSTRLARLDKNMSNPGHVPTHTLVAPMREESEQLIS